jgi:glucose-1-phosphate cytidylyltransferase
MKVAILAGGLGTRLSEETVVKPKPMVEVGEQPMLWHILKHYAHYGSKEFFIALGYKGEYIKRYFLDYYHLGNNLTIDLSDGAIHPHHSGQEDWIIHLIDTGTATNTGGRIKRLKPWLGTETFMLTYGDGISNLNLHDLLRFHRQHGRLATITAVRPPARFGGLVLSGDLVAQFTEKSQIGEGWINGGFMVLEPAVFQYLVNDDTNLETHVLERLANEGQLAAYRHDGFWHCMDTLRDKRILDSFWGSGNPPWKVWDD